VKTPQASLLACRLDADLRNLSCKTGSVEKGIGDAVCTGITRGVVRFLGIDNRSKRKKIQKELHGSYSNGVEFFCAVEW